ncbi:efflux RND transporter permease subunit [Elusimicrobiota bacterium]
MKITELAVKQPVTTIMFFLAVVIMGMISLFKTPRELLPSLVYPQITVVGVYENATPEEIERAITRVMEEVIGTVSNIKNIKSISQEGLSLVIAEFKWGTNMDIASMDVREKLDLVKERFPKEAQEPIVMKFNPFELPVLKILVSRKVGQASAQDLYEMKEVTRKVVKNSLEKLEGVASVEITGGREREILVEVDQARLRASEISLMEVVNIIKSSNLAYPAGTIKRRFFEYLIRTIGEYKTVDDIKKTPLKIQYFQTKKERKRDSIMRDDKDEELPKGLLLLSDIGSITDTYKEQESIFRHNDNECIAVSIKRQSGTNIVRVAKKIKIKLEELKVKLPADYDIKIIYDQSKYIEKSISGVAESAIMGSVLAFLVLLLFLENFRNSMIVNVAIPVSLIGTFILMYFQDISINMMSLGGLALGVGMLVDNSIVVLENIFRLNVIRPGEQEANAIDGAAEVTGAITSSTLTTITVFLPFIFVTGVAGQLFKELSYTVTYSLITSLVVAITLIPRLASTVKQGVYHEPEWTNKIKRYYLVALEQFLKMRIFYLFIIAMAFFLSVFVLTKISREFMPRTKQDHFIMKVELDPGTKIQVTDDHIRKIEGILRKFDKVEDVITNIGSSKESSGQAGYSLMGSNQAEIMIVLKGKLEYTENIIKKVKEEIQRNFIQGEIEYVTQVGVFGSALGGAAPISIEIKGDEMEDLIEISETISNRLSSSPFIYGIKSSFKGYRPEIKVEVNKDRAALYGIATQNVTLTAQTAVKGYVATKLKQEEEEIDIRVTLLERDRADYSRIGNILIRSPLNFDIELNQLATLENSESISEINRKESQRIVTISANFIGADFGKIENFIKSNISDLQKEYKDYIIDITGEKEKMKETFTSLLFVIVLSLLFVYMIMASQFESLWQPFIVIFTVPLSAIGVALILLVTNSALNVVVLLGIIMLGGIVVNNGIVLISYFNILKEKEEDLVKMVVKASTIRFRPVMMTAMTTILGLIPMAISGGQGSELRAPLAVTVIGGLLVSTFLTLFVIPAIYIEGERFQKKFNLKNIIKLINW